MGRKSQDKGCLQSVKHKFVILQEVFLLFSEIPPKKFQAPRTKKQSEKEQDLYHTTDRWISKEKSKPTKPKTAVKEVVLQLKN